MGRRLFTLCSGLSLLLLVAVCVLWVRSYSGADQFVWHHYVEQSTDGGTWFSLDQRINVAFHRGQAEFMDDEVTGLLVGYETSDPDIAEVDRPGWHFAWKRVPPGEAKWAVQGRGFHYREAGIGLLSNRGGFMITRRESSGVPLWSLAAALAAIPILIVTSRMWRRYGKGLCPTCGYDLRASPERCPECGTANPARTVTLASA